MLYEREHLFRKKKISKNKAAPHGRCQRAAYERKYQNDREQVTDYLIPRRESEGIRLLCL